MLRIKQGTGGQLESTESLPSLGQGRNPSSQQAQVQDDVRKRQALVLESSYQAHTSLKEWHGIRREWSSLRLLSGPFYLMLGIGTVGHLQGSPASVRLSGQTAPTHFCGTLEMAK